MASIINHQKESGPRFLVQGRHNSHEEMFDIKYQDTHQNSAQLYMAFTTYQYY